MSDFNKWFADKGDYTYRLNYDLNDKSVVVDLGGYNGWFVEQINNKYGSQIYVFEPIKSFYDGIVNKYGRFRNIKIYHAGVADKNGEETIYINNDASSIHIHTGRPEIIKLITLDQFFLNEKIEKIDLLKINIEGSEYPLLEDVINKGLHDKIVNIQVQFHKMGDYVARYENIKNGLSQTHKITYRYPFIWENWKLK